jgi:hypothetical protein
MSTEHPADIYPGRCTHTWAPDGGHHTRCTGWADLAHDHRWFSIEEDRWKERTLLTAIVEPTPAEGTWARDVLVHPDAVDLDPEGCPYTWRPAADTPLGRRYDQVRCTRRLHDDAAHHWDSREQEERIDRVRAVVLEAMPSALMKPLEATPIRIRPEREAQVQEIIDLLDNLHVNDGMPYAQYSALHDLVSGLRA